MYFAVEHVRVVGVEERGQVAVLVRGVGGVAVVEVVDGFGVGAQAGEVDGFMVFNAVGGRAKEESCLHIVSKWEDIEGRVATYSAGCRQACYCDSGSLDIVSSAIGGRSDWWIYCDMAISECQEQNPCCTSNSCSLPGRPLHGA